ncbi:hypothetical protein JCM10908_002694 [Rhodotorula pacifica]|uniref:uncharacterized protein n=1 Tax=Rhodotorula pacifica TaxID=1495444 RepID=UPI003174E3B3
MYTHRTHPDASGLSADRPRRPDDAKPTASQLSQLYLPFICYLSFGLEASANNYTLPGKFGDRIKAWGNASEKRFCSPIWVTYPNSWQLEWLYQELFALARHTWATIMTTPDYRQACFAACTMVLRSTPDSISTKLVAAARYSPSQRSPRAHDPPLHSSRQPHTNNTLESAQIAALDLRNGTRSYGFPPLYHAHSLGFETRIAQQGGSRIYGFGAQGWENAGLEGAGGQR